MANTLGHHRAADQCGKADADGGDNRHTAAFFSACIEKDAFLRATPFAFAVRT